MTLYIYKALLHLYRHKERAREVSALMRDQVDRPLDRAVNAMEYVIRHRGAPQLRPSAACKLPLLQRESFDVAFILSCLILLLAYATYCLASQLGRQLFKRVKWDKLKVD